jgi:NADPH-dependent 2,4-dienoyl-CoA reductase/sulfur reductase-like enzyme
MKHVVIIGNGIAGITAARHIRKLGNDRITVVSGETDHFFSRTALMYVFMGHMKFEHTKPYEDHFWTKNRIDLLKGWVSDIDFDQKQVKLGEQLVSYDALILALGSKPNKFGWPGQDLDGVQGLYSYQDLQLLEKNTHPPLISKSERKVRRAVIIGGGLIGVELAEMLHTRNIEVTFLIRESRFWGNVLPMEEGKFICRHIESHHVDLRLETELAEILPDEKGRVKSVMTTDGEEIECELVGLTAGVSANISLVKSSALETNRGIIVNRFLETNLPDVYAIGDCAESSEPQEGRRAIEQVWYTGRMMGEAVAKTICGHRTEYQPGFWFNSAKFFDIEYQTYGTVSSELGEGHSHFFWEQQGGRRCVKVVFESGLGRFIGINSMGIRLRHEVFDRWLREERDIKYVMQHMKDANFDPEFYKKHEKEILEQFNADFGTNLSSKAKSWQRILATK